MTKYRRALPQNMLKKEVDFEMVKKLCKIQCTPSEIAAVLEISRPTLDKGIKNKYKTAPGDKMAQWREGGHCSLRRKQWNLADTSAAVAIFLGKQYLDQDDNYNLKNTGAVNVNVVSWADQTEKPWGEINDG